MSILTNTAKEVNEGNLNIRSDIKGKDDIGLLGTTFDNMLDTIEKDINVLDKKVEERTSQLQSSLDEKEILLREIHHRVKNNLAMTIELIKIQKIKIKDSTTKVALGDIQERIHVMELLHRKLYESKNLSSINITKYINELVSDISQSYVESRNIKIDIKIDESYFMDIEHALPCGLIINECLTNSIKHAFIDNTGKIEISLVKVDQCFILKIEDNGVGIDKSINIKTSKTLGLRLISSIVRGQLLGTIDYETKNGASFTIKFKF
jgi:two-component sensor histidine kinase